MSEPKPWSRMTVHEHLDAAQKYVEEGGWSDGPQRAQAHLMAAQVIIQHERLLRARAARGGGW